MTKKDYETLAELLKQFLLLLEEDNPRFDKKKFIAELEKEA